MITSESFFSKPFSEDLEIAPVQHQRVFPRRLFLNLLALCDTALEFLSCAAVIVLVGTFCKPMACSTAVHLKIGVIAGAVVVVLLQMGRQRDIHARNDAVEETANAIRVSLRMGAILIFARALLFSQIQIPATLIACTALPFALMLQKHAFHCAIRKLKNRRYGSDRVVIYGAGETARRVASGLLTSTRLALHPVAIIDEDRRAVEIYRAETPHSEDNILVQSTSITPDLLRRLHCGLLIIARATSAERLQHFRTTATQASVPIAYCVSDNDNAGECVSLKGLQIALEGSTKPAWYYTPCKRIFDITVSSILLLVLFPAFLLLSLLIRLASPGPALFVQRRMGRNGEPFKMFKFRSMSSQARPYEFSPNTSQDPRITPIGAFLRKTSLDELPQLLNVFLGQMSLVGPRPEMPFIVRRYNAQQRRRLEVTPGITGLWQLSMDRRYPIHENIHHDLRYLQHRTFSLDIAILMHTVFFAMRGGV